MISLADEIIKKSGRDFATRLLEGIEDPTNRNIGSIKLKKNQVIPHDVWEHLYPALKSADHKSHPYNLTDADLQNLRAKEEGEDRVLWMPYLIAPRMKAYSYTRPAIFNGAYMPYSNFEGVDKKVRTSTHATTDLRCSWWVDADLSYSNLRHVEFRDACLSGTILIGADLLGSDLYGARMWEAVLVDPHDHTKTVKNLGKADGLGNAVFWRGGPFSKLNVTRDLRDIILQARKVADKEMFHVVD